MPIVVAFLTRQFKENTHDNVYAMYDMVVDMLLVKI